MGIIQKKVYFIEFLLHTFSSREIFNIVYLKIDNSNYKIISTYYNISKYYIFNYSNKQSNT